MRLLLPLLVCAGLRVLSGQTLPPYLIDTFPAPHATGVPTNVNIILRGRVSLPIPPFAPTGYYTLKTQTGPALGFTSLANCGCFATVLIPSAPLAANTLYTLTINPATYPGTDIGSAYSFSFTTGSSTDQTPPHLLSVDPPSGTPNVGINGPFRFQFDKRLSRTLIANQGVTVTPLSSYQSLYPATSLSDDGTILIVRANVLQGYPTGYDIKVDPTQFVDMFGNAGQGAAITAHYSTFVSTDDSGPHLKMSLPMDGETGVVTNVMPRLAFQKTIDSSTASKGIELRSGGTAQSITFSGGNDYPTAGSVLSIIPSKPLAPNQTYSIVITSALRDSNGFAVQQPQTIQFTTGSGPDLIAPAVVGYSPHTAYSPPDAKVMIRTNKPIAPMVLDRLNAIGLAYANSSKIVPATASLSTDGTLLTLTPQAPLTPDNFVVRTGEIVDAAGAPFFSNSGNAIGFNVSGNADRNPLTLLAVNPPPDAVDVPLFNTIQLRFNKPCANCLLPGVIAVAIGEGGKAAKVSGDYGAEDTSFTVNPGNLIASTTYTVSVTGALDLSGNVMPDYAFQFSTAAGALPARQLKFLDSAPSDGDKGVDPNGSIVLHYDAVLNPASAVTSATLIGPSKYAYPVRASASGSTLTVTPVAPLPANSTFQLTASVFSILGGNIQSQIAFTTAASDDSTRPEVTAISPGDGTALSQAQLPASFVLTFSKPFNPSTITADSISLYTADQRLSVMLVRSEDNRSVNFTLATMPASGFSVIASAAVKDLAGNSLAPFEAHYQVTPTAYTNNGNYSFREMRPAFGSTGVPANTAITWFVDRPLDLAAIQASLLVLVDNAPVPGTLDLLAGGRILRFTPSNPFPAGASISFYERTPILNINNYYSYSSFTIASPPDPVLRFVRTTFGASVAVDSVFEIEFTQDPPLGQNIAQVAYYPPAWTNLSWNGAFTESIPRPHILRLTPTVPKQAGSYNVTLSNKVIGDINAPRYLYSTLTAATVGGTPAVISVGPAAGSTGVPLNASVRILFGAPVNALTVTAQTATLSVGGRVLSVQRIFPVNNLELILRPLEALPPNARVDVLLSGLQDLAGRTIAVATWSFSTGGDIDTTSPAILSTSLPAIGNGTAEIASREVVQVVFTEPVDPGLAVQIGISGVSGWQNDVATLTLSPDLRTLTIAPVGAWAKGQVYSLTLQYLMDLSGNQGSLSGPTNIGFQVAFDPSTQAPSLLAISPPDGSTAMPLNARVIAAFDRPISVPLDGVRLTDGDGNAVELVRAGYSVDSSQATFAPVRALRPNTTYRLTLLGATDMSGNRMQSGASATFVTGEVPDYVGPTGSVMITSPLPTNLPLRVRFSEPISPASLTAQQVQLFAGTTQLPADLALSGDGITLTVTPRQQLAPGKSYALNVVAPTDFAGNPAILGSNAYNGYKTTFVAGDSADNAPPVITFFPPDGASGYPVALAGYNNTPIVLRVAFSESADVVASPPLLRVLKDGNPVPGAVAVVINGASFTPATPLEYNATYRMEISNVADYAGNAAPPASATFTTSQSAAADNAALKVVSIQPASGSVGVANDSPIAITFTKAVAANQYPIQIRVSNNMPVTGIWSASGSTLTFTPNDPWPSAVTVTLYIPRQSSGVYFRDLTGTILDKDYTFTFTTAVRPDPTPLTLVSATPAGGTPISPNYNTFTLVFSKPVVLAGQAVQAFVGSQSASPNTYYGASSRRLTVSVYALTAESVLTLIGSENIQDETGNAIQPFTLQYPITKNDESGNPTVLSISPGNNANAVAPDTPIKLQFNKAMDPDTVLASVRVTQDGEEILGQLQMLDTNHAVQFTPNAAYKSGSRIDVFVFQTAADPAGTRLSQRYQSFFTVAGKAPETMSVSLAGFGDAVSPAAALELAFDRDVDAATIGEDSLWLRAGHTRIPGSAVPMDARTLRFQPAEPLRSGEHYVLTAGPNLRSLDGRSNEPREFRFQVDEAAVEVRVESVEYLRDSAPLAVRIRFSGPVSPLSARGLKLLAPDGAAVRASSVRLSTDGREWLLELPAARPVRVVLDGVVDRWGHRLPGESREPVVAR